uniref:Uncharacterized protein n=1 Tax=Romanomermis culicivorax TaxID=13658 RepID=A0A915IQ17_ROMCU
MARTAKRREQSRRSAHNRRVIEAELYSQLKQALPIKLTDQDVIKPDRVAFLRLATSYYKLRRFASKILNSVEENVDTKPVFNDSCVIFDGITSNAGVEEAFNACLTGFVVAVDCQDTRILYSSSNISNFLGYTQIDTIGMPFKEFILEGDWFQLRNVLQAPSLPTTFQKVHFRMNTALTTKSDRCKKVAMSFIQLAMSCVKYLKFDGHNYAFLYCEPVITSHLSYRTFGYGKPIITKHEVDMKIRCLDESLAHLLKYAAGSKSLVGISYYSLIHPDDLPFVQASFKQMYQSGYCSTKYYRLIRNFEGYLWVQTDASLQKHTIKGLSTNYVLCYSHVLGPQNDKLITKLRKGDLKNLLKSTLHRKLKSKQSDPAAPPPQPSVHNQRNKVFHYQNHHHNHVYHHRHYNYHPPARKPGPSASFIHKRPIAKLVLPKICCKQEKKHLTSAVATKAQHQQKDALLTDAKYSPVTAATAVIPEQSLQLKTADFLELCSEVAPLALDSKVNTGLTPLIEVVSSSATIDLNRYQDVLENPTSQIDDGFLATMTNADTSTSRMFKTDPDEHNITHSVEVTEKTPTFINAVEMQPAQRYSQHRNDLK